MSAAKRLLWQIALGVNVACVIIDSACLANGMPFPSIAVAGIVISALAALGAWEILREAMS